MLLVLTAAALAVDVPLSPCYHHGAVHLALPEDTSDVALRDALRQAFKRHGVSSLELLQELGHALTATPVRRDTGPQLLPLPMAALRTSRSRLTLYAESNDTEAFAEAFAMFHVDPAALLRTAPGLLARFSAEDHLPP